jgi:hypothetical protein
MEQLRRCETNGFIFTTPSPDRQHVLVRYSVTRYFCSVWRVIAAAFAGAVLTASAVSAADVPSADLQAAIRTLQFIDTLQHRSPITIGVVYRSGDAESKAAAQRAATALSGMRGPNAAPIAASAVSLEELGQGQHRPDILYAIPGLAEGGRTLGEFVRRQHVISISNDPACLGMQGCVLLVRGGRGVDIILDSNLAEAAGSRFAAVFTMMVKRK